MTGTKQSDVRVFFGEAVRKLRTAKGISQEGLADEAGIHRTYVGDVERGTRNIALINISRIAAALGISMSRLMQEAEKQALKTKT